MKFRRYKKVISIALTGCTDDCPAKKFVTCIMVHNPDYYCCEETGSVIPDNIVGFPSDCPLSVDMDMETKGEVA